MAILDNYIFRPLLVIGLSSKELKVLLHCARTWCIDLYIRALLRYVIYIFGGMLRAYHQIYKLHYAIRPVCRDLCTTCAHNVYSRTLSSLEDNLKMASKGRNM